MSLAMLLMYWYPVARSGGAVATAMSGSPTGAKLDPGLGFLLAVLLFASAIFTLASPTKGASHHGTHVTVSVTGTGTDGVSGPLPAPGLRLGQGTSVGALETLVTAPWLEDASHVVMCIGMGFMLILML
jgi:hypothetical protein